MQKISLYLVPNRITVTTDVTNFTTEFRQVYTRKVKLYRGIDNTVEFDVRNSENKKQSIVGKTPRVVLFDTEQQRLLEKDGTLLAGTTHLFSVTFTAAELADIDKQLLHMAAYLSEDGTNTIIYGDSQFGMHTHVQLLDGINDRLDFVPEQEITLFNRTWNFQTQEGLYTSELAKFAPKINDDSTNSTTVTIYPGSFRGTVSVEATKDISTASSNTWTTVSTVLIADGSESSVTISGPYTYLRFLFPENETGKVDKITVRN